MILPTFANDARSLATKILIKAYREIQNRWFGSSTTKQMKGKKTARAQKRRLLLEECLRFSGLGPDNPSLI